MLLRSRMLIILAVCAWLVTLTTWLVSRSDGMGGRPLTTIWSEDPKTYDPHRTSYPVAQTIFRHVCEPLLYVDFDGNVRGLLAEDAIEYVNGGQRLVIRLRPDIRFHDGALLDAQAVQTSFERLQQHGVSPLLNDLRDVRVMAQDDRATVVFDLPAPDYEFARTVLSSSYAVIVSPQTHGTIAPGFVACTGPYRFVTELYQSGKSLTLARSPNYRSPPQYFANRGAANIPQMRFVFEPDRDARLAMLLDGRACVLSLSQEQTAALEGTTRFRLYEDTGGVTYVGFNFQRERWQDARMRQAVAHALDKHALASSGPFLAAHTPLSPEADGYSPQIATFSREYAPEHSRTLLAEAAFDSNAEIVMLIPESVTYRQLALIVKQQLEAVGFTNIQVRALPRDEILTTRQDFDLLLFDYAWDSYTALAAFLGPGPRNLLNYPNNDIAARVAQARTTDDTALHGQLIADAQRDILAQALWQPLVVRRVTVAVDSACVSGERQSPRGELLFHDAVSAPMQPLPYGRGQGSGARDQAGLVGTTPFLIDTRSQ
jgi:peptide/nickel transport system substrate-binding protein